MLRHRDGAPRQLTPPSLLQIHAPLLYQVRCLPDGCAAAAVGLNSASVAAIRSPVLPVHSRARRAGSQHRAGAAAPKYTPAHHANYNEARYR